MNNANKNKSKEKQYWERMDGFPNWSFKGM